MQSKMILTVLPVLALVLNGTVKPPDSYKDKVALNPQNNTLFEHVVDIPLPAGFKRQTTEQNSFGSWLRNRRLKPDNTVYLFDGTKKKNQSAQFAVLDINLGPKDLQQCADAVMRLRAEYLYHQGKTRQIIFKDNSGKKYLCPDSPTIPEFEKYLEKVFAYCGTSSLSKQLTPVVSFADITPGDVLIKGGFPGHAVIVMDLAVDKYGKKIFLLAQSYMPAQSVHILRNPLNNLSPWYSVDSGSDLVETPEWTFYRSQLMKW